MRTIAFFLFFSSLWASYKQEGAYAAHFDGERRFAYISYLLPYNPKILVLGSNAEIEAICKKQWLGQAKLVANGPCDMIWVESDSEIDLLSQNLSLLEHPRLIYTSTHQKEGAFQRLQSFLDTVGFSFLCHWYLEDGEGNAIFLKKPIMEAYIHTLAYNPPLESRLLPKPPPSKIEKFLKPALNKTDDHSFGSIDFIYMINLDERPEKFALAAGALELYGIHPYRFSAVNGWKLPNSTLSQLGAVFVPGTLRESFLGSYYKEVEGGELIHTEIIQEDGTSYFTWGLARGPVGIVLSHVSVLQDAYNSGYQTIWVMEDDVEAIEDPRQIPQLLKKLDQLVPDWDIFFTDVDTKDADGIHICCRAFATRPNVPIPPFSTFIDKFHAIGEGFYRTGMRYGAYSMIIRRSAMKKILNYYKTYGIFLPYDMDYWLCPDLKMYHFERDLVSHRAGAHSDNNQPRYEP